jgi:hypothetical protein
MGKAKLTRHTTRQLAADIRASLCEALDHAAGKCTGVVVHKAKPRATQSRSPGCARRAGQGVRRRGTPARDFAGADVI